MDVPLANGLRVQILPSIADLPRARKHQFAAFIADEGILVVWDDDSNNIIARAKKIESELMELVWQAGNEAESVNDFAKEKSGVIVTEAEVDEESGQLRPQERATHLINTVLVGFTLVVVIVMLGAGMRSVAIEVMVDQNYLRLAFVLLTPVQIFFTLVSLAPVLLCTTIFRYVVTHTKSFHKLIRTSSSPKSSLVVSLSALDRSSR